MKMVNLSNIAVVTFSLFFSASMAIPSSVEGSDGEAKTTSVSLKHTIALSAVTTTVQTTDETATVAAKPSRTFPSPRARLDGAARVRDESLPREVTAPLLIKGSMNWFLLNETFPVDLPLYQPGFVWVIPLRTGTLDEEVRKLEERKLRQQMTIQTRKGS